MVLQKARGSARSSRTRPNRAKGGRNPLLFFSSTFSCQWKSSTIIWQGFFGAIKATHTTRKSRWKSPGWHRCAPREGHCSLEGEHGTTWESKKDASATSLRRQHNFRLPLHLGYAKPHHLTIFVLWSCSENVLGAVTVWEFAVLPAVS